jgi:hypothetical protein
MRLFPARLVISIIADWLNIAFGSISADRPWHDQEPFPGQSRSTSGEALFVIAKFCLITSMKHTRFSCDKNTAIVFCLAILSRYRKHRIIRIAEFLSPLKGMAKTQERAIGHSPSPMAEALALP